MLGTILYLPVPRHWLGQRDVEEIVFWTHKESLEEWVARDLRSLTEEKGKRGQAQGSEVIR